MSQKNILQRLFESERVNLTIDNYFSFVRKTILFILTITIIAIGSTLLFSGISFLSIGICGVLFILSITLVTFLKRNIMSSAVKGGTLIFKRMNNKAYVTSIRAIKEIKSFQLLKKEFTLINFELDGQIRMAIVINNKDDFPFSNEKFIIRAKEIYKKQKANHKPGSVTLA